MIQCAACGVAVAESSRFCSSCGGAVDVAASPTYTAPSPSRRTPEAAPRHSSGGAGGVVTAADGEGRFVPGTLLAARFRIVGLLGKGGMGEVYRADDLKLGLPVALKFLPAGVERDPERLARMIGEVRVARQISHPAVCRVHDLEEVDGHHFLSMELVDGEDLASLLRRIGRLPPDKALDIARQLCAGLAAAHERGVLHRDLKPANVMLDGRGKVRITDFGLAGLVEAVKGGEIRSGTPAYMSPEQLSGKQVTVRSDLYALGLVLYEVFTGRRAFDGRTATELARKHLEEEPVAPSALVEGLDPSIESCLLRCLEKDPEQRPRSALGVLALLPGGDPLAVALAAGETPSPEQVAAAGVSGALRPRVAWACFAAALLGLVGYAVAPRRWQLFRQVRLESAPEVLEYRSREVLRRAGYPEAPVDRARGFETDFAYLQHVLENDRSVDRWSRLASGQPAAVYFWYRQSPQPMVPAEPGGTVTLADPPLAVSGMAEVRLDPRGRLLELAVVPPEREEPAVARPPVDFTPLFEEAGLEPGAFKRADPGWTPPFFSDDRTAWEGVFPERPDIPIRIEAASYRGRPCHFRLLTPWQQPERTAAWGGTKLQLAAFVVQILLLVVVVVAAALLARRNLRLGRGDRRGARRLAAGAFATLVAIWALKANHVPQPLGEFEMLFKGVSLSLSLAVVVWLLYMALEPYLRRTWPDRMISWSRALGGRLRDPLVGRDVLIGAAGWGVYMAALEIAGLIPRWLGFPGPMPDPSVDLNALVGPSRALASLLGCLFVGVTNGLTVVFLLLLLRTALRRTWLAALALGLVVATQTAFLVGGGVREMGYMFCLALGVYLVYLGVFLHFGLLAFLSLCFYDRLAALPITSDVTAWNTGLSVVVLGLGAVLAAWAFRTSRRAQPVASHSNG
jgi:serine/threonine-protein kinase